jgi:hypothetical protein
MVHAANMAWAAARRAPAAGWAARQAAGGAAGDGDPAGSLLAATSAWLRDAPDGPGGGGAAGGRRAAVRARRGHLAGATLQQVCTLLWAYARQAAAEEQY